MLILVLLVAAAAFAADAPPANPAGVFNHKQHAAMKLQCGYCHAGAAKSERAGFPAAATQCKACHTGIDDRKLPTQRVYRLADYVIFSHARHIAGKLECASCHGDVNAAAEIKIERPITMFACVACHKEHKANNTCTACHELGQ